MCALCMVVVTLIWISSGALMCYTFMTSTCRMPVCAIITPRNRKISKSVNYSAVYLFTWMAVLNAWLSHIIRNTRPLVICALCTHCTHSHINYNLNLWNCRIVDPPAANFFALASASKKKSVYGYQWCHSLELLLILNSQ